MTESMTFKHLNRLVLASILVVFATTTSLAQATECDPLPKSEFWSTATHDSIKSYVKRKHDGDWAAYVAKWQRQLDSMKAIHERGGGAVYKSKGMTISGEKLVEYVKALEARVNVTKCLAGQ